jgi:tetratricopeptide (TPR) repeat protein
MRSVVETILDIDVLSKSRPRFRDMLSLSFERFGEELPIAIGYGHIASSKERGNSHRRYHAAMYACFLSNCSHDRNFLDAITVNQGLCPDPWTDEYALVQHQIGRALCDLGFHADGIRHIREAITHDTGSGRYLYWAQLARYLNTAADVTERLWLSENLLLELQEKYKDEYHAIRARAFIDAGRLDEAAALVPKLPSIFRFVEAELYFAQKDYQRAAAVFAVCGVSGWFYWWRPQFDYKEALTYFYLGQTDKCRRKVLAMRRRSKWDRFYRLQDVEQFGAKREPFIDDILNSDGPDNCLIDREKWAHYRRMFPPVLKGWMRGHPVIVFAVTVALLFAALCWIRPPWR